jgi:hypothetical protein
MLNAMCNGSGARVACGGGVCVVLAKGVGVAFCKGKEGGHTERSNAPCMNAKSVGTGHMERYICKLTFESVQ